MVDDKFKLLIKNSEILDEVKNTFGMNIFKKCNALNITMKNKVANANKINSAIDLIKGKTFLFSNFRVNNLLTTAVLIANEENMEESLNNIIEIYEGLKNLFFNNQYLVLAAQIIFSARYRVNIYDAIKNTRVAYDYMKKNHRFLTGNEDICSAAIIATTSKDFEVTFLEIEECYNLLRNSGFCMGNNLQSLTNMLSLINLTSEEKVKKVNSLYNALENNSVPLKGYALPLLGVAPFITDDYSNFAKEVSEVVISLRKERGFGIFSLNSYIRNMIAVGIVILSYLDDLSYDIKENISNITNNTSLTIVIAMEIAASTAAAGAAAAAASANN